MVMPRFNDESIAIEFRERRTGVTTLILILNLV